MGKREKSPADDDQVVAAQAALDAEDARLCLMRVAPLAARRFILDEQISSLVEQIKRLKRERKHVQWDMDLLLAKAGRKAGGAPGT